MEPWTVDENPPSLPRMTRSRNNSARQGFLHNHCFVSHWQSQHSRQQVSTKWGLISLKRDLTVDHTFKNFNTFITNEYSKHVKGNKISAKAVSFGIVNNTQVKAELTLKPVVIESNQAALAVAEITHNIQAEHDKKLQEFMTFTKEMP